MFYWQMLGGALTPLPFRLFYFKYFEYFLLSIGLYP